MNSERSPSLAEQIPAARLALPALFAGAVAIAFAPIFVRLSQVGPSATAFWRLALALPFLWLATGYAGPGAEPAQRPASPSDYLGLAAAGLFFAADLAFWHWSIRLTSVANATLLANFAPVFVTLGGWLFFRQRVSPAFLLGMLVALAGTTILVGVSLSLSPQHLLGDGLGLITAVFYGGYILAVSRLRRRFAATTILAWGGLVTAVVLLPVALLSGEGLWPIDIWGWLVLLGLALLSHAGGQGLIAFALAHLPAAFSSVSLLVQPVLATVFAWLLLSEALTLWQALGGALVLGGIYLARQASR